jgi:hypothetical protein
MHFLPKHDRKLAYLEAMKNLIELLQHLADKTDELEAETNEIMSKDENLK